MLNQRQRATILELFARGVSRRQIAKVLKLSRKAVNAVINSGSRQVPESFRAQCELGIEAPGTGSGDTGRGSGVRTCWTATRAGGDEVIASFVPCAT